MSLWDLPIGRPTRHHDAGYALVTYRGRGASHFVLVPGLVPDGPETFLRQIPVLRGHGDVTVLSYPRDHFNLETLLCVLHRRVGLAAQTGRRPVLVGVSVGGGFCLELLRRMRLDREDVSLGALVLISPLTCAEDLAPLLRRLLAPVLSAPDAAAGVEALERGRAFFRALASRSAGATGAGRWPPWVRPLRERAELRLRDRINHTLADISPLGGIERCRAVARLVGLESRSRFGPLCAAPTLLLWGSKERHTLDMNGPGVAELSRPDFATRHFPRAQVQWVYDLHGNEVPHASLLLHHGAFNRALSSFLRRRQLQRPASSSRPSRLGRPTLDEAAANLA